VSTYGAIASYLGLTRSARMVGWALNQAVGDDSIPAHRVVNRQGLLTGRLHFQPPERMQALLEAEGIIIKNHQVQNLQKHYWDPTVELP
jgi:methylated-DNA-protein-cysteine methyltransferase-like protein